MKWNYTLPTTELSLNRLHKTYPPWKLTWNLKLYPLEKETHRPTPPIFGFKRLVFGGGKRGCTQEKLHLWKGPGTKVPTKGSNVHQKRMWFEWLVEVEGVHQHAKNVSLKDLQVDPVDLERSFRESCWFQKDRIKASMQTIRVAGTILFGEPFFGSFLILSIG